MKKNKIGIIIDGKAFNVDCPLYKNNDYKVHLPYKIMLNALIIIDYDNNNIIKNRYSLGSEEFIKQLALLTNAELITFEELVLRYDFFLPNKKENYEND